MEIDIAAAMVEDLKRANDSDPSPEFLYHYTNAVGLQGILRTKTIWATQFDFLNDRSEFVYAIDIMQERFKSAALHDGPLIEETAKALRTLPHYVASFCEDPDLVSQWRGYAHTNDGYAIGFRSKNLPKSPSQGIARRLIQLIYPRIEQDRRLDEILNAASQAIAKSAENMPYAVAAVVAGFFPLMYRFKHELFKSEQEWRLVGHVNDPASERFRIVSGHFVPYLAFPLEPDDIAVIVEGPGSYRSGNKEAIERFAKSCGFAPRVIRSGVPLV